MVLELVWDVLDLAGDGAKVLKILQGSLFFKSLPGVLKDIVHDEAEDGVMFLKISQGNLTESFIKIQHQEACKDSTFPPSLFLESLRTGMFLMKLKMVSGYPKYPKEALLKVLSRSNIRKLVTTTPIIKVSSWSLGGYGGS